MTFLMSVSLLSVGMSIGFVVAGLFNSHDEEVETDQQKSKKRGRYQLS